MTRFHINADGTRVKYTTINNITYQITISKQTWETIPTSKIYKNTSYWMRYMKLGKTPTLKYGTYMIVDDIPSSDIHECTICHKIYKSRSGFLKHIQKHQLDTPTEVITPTTITNQTINNIQNNNITICPFGKENPRWITEKVIIDSLRNMPCAIMNLVKEKHFNDKFPENRNVYMCNEFKNRYVMVQEDTRKAIQDRRLMFEQMCSNACDAVTTTLEAYNEPPDSDDDNEEHPEIRRCRLIANRLHRSGNLSSLVDRYLHKWEEYVADVQMDDVIKDADHYITMLLLDLKLALTQEEEMINKRTVMG